MPERRRPWVWIGLAGAVVILDQITKVVLERSLAFGASVPIGPFLDLVHVRNSGAAFSFLAGASGWQRELFIGIGTVASIWIVWLIFRSAGERLFCAALALILGGAIGNVLDRIRLGAVVDFLHFHWGPYYWPAFNAADTSIFCGAALLVWDAFRQTRASRGGGAGETG